MLDTYYKIYSCHSGKQFLHNTCFNRQNNNLQICHIYIVFEIIVQKYIISLL